ncbi:hypothetical protein PPERSA_08064 [Pseudocohnilembus persalinus]|uniref:G patch domain-containing protein n=1 Tax=Pseudocohnilembus persalinus TaxID=266149 RepID=A0A0V0R2P2_PSEPJ|nr:hypothetical protein PPERSA_08064 [Pseudocohnilembus persalinus]|eukprot:KRX08753.1 hypothetical protein PPERSA_08064 [Pseudocohnilembus persalinus]
MIGTPFEEEEISKKSNIHQQTVKNREINKHLYGNVHGFKNDKFYQESEADEFVPKAFFSSRSQRAKKITQNISDLMDDQDLGMKIIGTNLIVNEKYSSLGNQQNDSLASQLGIKQFGFQQVQNENEADQHSIGYKILKQQKQKMIQSKIDDIQIDEEENNEQILNKYYQMYAENLSDSEKDDNAFEKKQEINQQYLQLKQRSQKFQNYEGYGFNQFNTNNQQTDQNLLQIFNQLMKSRHIDIDKEEAEKKEKNKIKVNFQNNQDDYLDDEDEDEDVMGYNKKKEIEYKYQYSFDQIQANQQFVLQFFHKKQKDNKQDFQKFGDINNQIEVPEDYNIYERIQNQENIDQENRTIKKNEQRNLQKRQNLLGEDKLEYLREQIPTKKFTQGKNLMMDNFENDDEQESLNTNEENQRSKNKKILLQPDQSEGGLMSKEEFQKEVEEQNFLQEKQFQKKTAESLFDKLNSLKKNTRKTEKWFPEKLLCKRFGVPQPHQEEIKMMKFIKEQEKESLRQTIKFEKYQSQNQQQDKNNFVNQAMEIEQERENKNEQEKELQYQESIKNQLESNDSINPSLLKQFTEDNPVKQEKSIYQSIFEDSDTE